MKKIIALILFALLSISFVACDSAGPEPETELNMAGFNFVYNENNDYVWIGMRRSALEEIGINQVEEREDDTLVLFAEGIRVRVDNFYGDERVRNIQTYSHSHANWFAHGGSTIGFSVEELKEVFDTNYVYLDDAIQFGLGFFDVYFAYDHTPVPVDSGNVSYSIHFRFQEFHVVSISVIGDVMLPPDLAS